MVSDKHMLNEASYILLKQAHDFYILKEFQKAFNSYVKTINCGNDRILIIAYIGCGNSLRGLNLILPYIF